jgi:hypothetical protein
MTIAHQGFGVACLLAVQLIALQQNGLDAVHMRTVRVLGLLTFGMVLAVNRRPFPGHLPGRQPQPETKEMRHNRVQIQRTVRLVPVQKNGHADHGDMRHQPVQTTQFASRSNPKGHWPPSSALFPWSFLFV